MSHGSLDDHPVIIRLLLGHLPMMAVFGVFGFLLSNIGSLVPAWSHVYHDIVHAKLMFSVDAESTRFSAGSDFHYFVNDFLMVFFFLMVGAEVRREILKFSKPSEASAPLIAALGGVMLPALIAAVLAPDYWSTIFGVPMATDIAWALALAAVLGVKGREYVILLLLAVADDIFGILVIAIFYSKGIDLTFLAYALVTSGILFWCGVVAKIHYKGIYLIGCMVLWYLFHEAGIHPTLAGVVAGFCAPYDGEEDGESTSMRIERVFALWFRPLILGAFAFVNLGINVQEIVDVGVVPSVTTGIALGLFIGKIAGVTGALWLLKKVSPASVQFKFVNMVRLGALAGIGLTVALFINNLAFDSEELLLVSGKVGILIGSALAAFAAWLMTVIIRSSEAVTNKQRPAGSDFPGTSM